MSYQRYLKGKIYNYHMKKLVISGTAIDSELLKEFTKKAEAKI